MPLFVKLDPKTVVNKKYTLQLIEVTYNLNQRHRHVGDVERDLRCMASSVTNSYACGPLTPLA